MLRQQRFDMLKKANLDINRFHGGVCFGKNRKRCLPVLGNNACILNIPAFFAKINTLFDKTYPVSGIY